MKIFLFSITLSVGTLFGLFHNVSPVFAAFTASLDQITCTSMRVNWTDATADLGSGVWEYMPQRKIGAGAWVDGVGQSALTPPYTYTETFTGLTAGVTYDVRVRARNSRGDVIIYTNPIVSATTTCATPTPTPTPTPSPSPSPSPSPQGWFTVKGKVHSQARQANNVLLDSIKSVIPGANFFNTQSLALTTANGAINVGTDNSKVAPAPIYKIAGYSTNSSIYSYANFRKRLQGTPTTWPGLLPTTNGVYQAFGPLAISTSWTVASGQYFTVFVNGDLTIDQNITVAEGGLVSFIVSGDIKVKSTVSQIQGIFFTDGKFYSTY